MLKLDLYNKKGEKKGTVDVPEEIFGAAFNEGLVHQALLRQLSNARLGMISHTKTKGEVRGGGRKPFRQKGTGNARQGSIRNPHMRTGGVAMGPRNTNNYKKDMPRKQRRLALFSALSAKFKDGKVLALDTYDETEIKTKKLIEMIQKLPIEKDVLIVIPEKNPVIERSSNNIPFAKSILVNYLNIADIQKHDHLLFLEESINKMKEIFLPKAK